MTPQAALRLLLACTLLLAASYRTTAQQRFHDPEPEAPRLYLATAAATPLLLTPAQPDAALTARHAELVRYFTRTLALQPHQALAVRRALALTVLQQLPATDTALPEVSPIDEVRLCLTPQQLAQLQQLADSPVPAPELKWLALSR